jgi:hypothetical protein
MEKYKKKEHLARDVSGNPNEFEITGEFMHPFSHTNQTNAQVTPDDNPRLPGERPLRVRTIHKCYLSSHKW